MQISLADLKYAINYGTLSWFGKKTRAHNWRLPSLRSCSGEHERKSLECDWLSPWSRVVTADMSAAQQKAAAAGGAASAETLPWPRAGAGLALIRATGFAAQPEDRPWCGADRRAQDARGQQATQAALRLRQSDAQAHLRKQNPRGRQVSRAEVLGRLAVPCLPSVALLTYACSQRHYPTDERARRDPPTLIRGERIKNARPLLDRL